MRNVDSLLADLGVETEGDHHEDVLQSPALEEEKGAVYLAARGRILADPVVTHDAFHRLLILKVRGGTPSFARARAWFLTCDGKLGRYDRISRGRDKTPVPYCIYPDQCLQITRWALPRTDDYDRAFVELVASPYTGTIAQAVQLPSRATHLICARIDQYRRERDISEETAAQAAVLVLVDKRLEASFRRPASDDQHVRETDEAIARALQEIDKRTARAEQASALARRAALRLISDQRRYGLERDAQEAALERERESARQATEARAQAEAEKCRVTEELSASERAREAEVRRADTAERRLRSVFQGTRWAFCGGVWLGMIVVPRLLSWAEWPPVARASYAFAAPVVSGLVLALPLGLRCATKIVLAITTIAGLLLACLQYFHA